RIASKTTGSVRCAAASLANTSDRGSMRESQQNCSTRRGRLSRNISKPAPEVMNSAQCGNSRYHPNQSVRPPGRNNIGRRIADQNRQRKRNLQESAGLSPYRRRKAPNVREQDGRAAEGENQKITGENFDHQPPGNTRSDRQRDVDRAQKDLVRNRIEVRADAGSHAETPRQRPVNRIGQRRAEHDPQRPPMLRAQNRANSEGNTRQPRQREQVGEI